VLVVPLLVLYLYGPRTDAEPTVGRRRFRPRFPLRPNILWIALTAAGTAAYSLYLQIAYGDALGWKHEQYAAFARVTSFPLETAWKGAVAAWQATKDLRRYLNTTPTGSGWNWENAQAMIALLEFGILVLVVIAIVGTFGRLPFAYGAYALASLLVILWSKIVVSYPNDIGRPLQSLHRFAAVIFPLFIWLGLVSHERKATSRVAAAFGVFLGLFTAMFATRHWLV
jgi:hypothetical protein